MGGPVFWGDKEINGKGRAQTLHGDRDFSFSRAGASLNTCPKKGSSRTQPSSINMPRAAAIQYQYKMGVFFA
jgi:hypothetical protein